MHPDDDNERDFQDVPLFEDPSVNMPGKVGREHPRSSKNAALFVFPRSGIQRHKILTFVMSCGEHGATDEEIQDHLRMSPNSETPRRLELWEGEWIANSGEERPTRSGIGAIVWVATAKARAHAETVDA